MQLDHYQWMSHAELLAAVEALAYQVEELTGAPPPIYPELTVHERRVFGALMARRGTVLSKRQLIAATRIESPQIDDPKEGVINLHIFRIRKKLAYTGMRITAIRGEGFMLENSGQEISRIRR
jgi:DNA-binding response OmpR family regulator